MLGSNGTSAGEIKISRYFLHYNHRQIYPDQLEWCVRDSHTPDWDFVFTHAQRQVCEKVLKLLNEG